MSGSSWQGSARREGFTAAVEWRGGACRAAGGDMNNPEIARVFSNLAVMLEMDGANTFRVRAYREAARVIETQGEPVPSLCGEPGRLESIRGIGKDLARKIRDVCATGTTAVYEELKAKYPPEVV